ncbi:hypothetical protein ACIBG8_42025 [Nonomuraea sp. NPDC050556]|uniref:hypothetical protein n=1 Tax=Nonomuraea sp. NPDC050556 TaxID=3364369 RepID=UPI00379DFD81
MNKPWTLVTGAAVVAVEGLAALAFGIFLGVETLGGGAQETTAAIAEVAFFLLIGAGLVWVAYGGLFKVERWGRTPGVLAQIFLIPVGGTVLADGQPLIGVPLLVLAVLGIGTLLAPPTTQALYGEDR